MSFGLLNFLPSYFDAIVVIVPSCSNRKIVRLHQPATVNRPSLSNVMPFAWPDGRSTTSRPTPGFHFQIVLPMISTQYNWRVRLSHTGPSPKVKPCAMLSSGGSRSTTRSKPGAMRSVSTRTSRGPGFFSERVFVGHHIDDDRAVHGKRFRQQFFQLTRLVDPERRTA